MASMKMDTAKAKMDTAGKKMGEAKDAMKDAGKAARRLPRSRNLRTLALSTTRAAHSRVCRPVRRWCRSRGTSGA